MADKQSLSAKALCLRVILLCFSVSPAHSHYEILHNVEALQDNRKKNFKEAMNKRKRCPITTCMEVLNEAPSGGWAGGGACLNIKMSHVTTTTVLSRLYVSSQKLTKKKVPK